MIAICVLFLYLHVNKQHFLYDNDYIWLSAIIFLFTLLAVIDFVFNRYTVITVFDTHLDVKAILTGKSNKIYYYQIQSITLKPIKNKVSAGYYNLIIQYDNNKTLTLDSDKIQNFYELKAQINIQYMKAKGL